MNYFYEIIRNKVFVSTLEEEEEYKSYQQQNHMKVWGKTRGEFETPGTFEINFFVAIVNGWKLLFISGKSFILYVAGPLMGPLKLPWSFN